jgi:hypothetical protein
MAVDGPKEKADATETIMLAMIVSNTKRKNIVKNSTKSVKVGANYVHH